MPRANILTSAKSEKTRCGSSADDTRPQYQSHLTTDAESMRLRLIKLSDTLSMSINETGTACLYDSRELEKLEQLDTAKEQMALLESATIVDLDAEEVHAIAQLLSLHVVYQMMTEDEDDEDANSTYH